MKKVLAWLSLPALAMLAVVVGLSLRKEKQAVAQPVLQSAYIPPAAVAGTASPVRFSDVTADSGIQFRHHGGAFTQADGSDSRYMPESMGPGVALFDYDNDGDLDIFLPDSRGFGVRENQASEPASHLYRNDGGMHFTDVAAEANLQLIGYGMGAAAADYDGDGQRDLLYTGWGGLRLLRNLGNGRFSDVTAKVGLESHLNDTTKARPWPTTAVFFDADGDGALDLFVAYYVQWSPATDVFATLDGQHKSYAKPDLYPGSTCRLFLQRHGNFVDVTQSHGVQKDSAKALGVTLWDFNSDGRLDIAVSNDTQPNFLFEAKGDGYFEERGLEAGVAYDENGGTRAGMGIDAADIENNSTAAVAIGNFSREPVSVFKMNAPGFFREASQQAGVAAPSYLSLTFGLAFADLDLDGWQDLVLANGHIEPRVQDVEAEVSYRQPLQVLGNKHDGTFADWSRTAGAAVQQPMVARGLAVGDLDGDGDLDLVVTENNGPMHILRNDLPEPGKHFLRVAVAGRGPNTDVLGTTIVLHAGNIVQRRVVRTGSSYMSQSELTQTFGIPAGATVEKVVVTWPDGEAMSVEHPQLNTTLKVRRD